MQLRKKLLGGGNHPPPHVRARVNFAQNCARLTDPSTTLKSAQSSQISHRPNGGTEGMRCTVGQIAFKTPINYMRLQIITIPDLLQLFGSLITIMSPFFTHVDYLPVFRQQISRNCRKVARSKIFGEKLSRFSSETDVIGLCMFVHIPLLGIAELKSAILRLRATEN